MIVIDIIKILEDAEIYAISQVIYRENDLTMTSRLYLSRDTAQAFVDGIIEFSEKLNIKVNVRWIYPHENKIFYRKGGCK